MPDELTSTPQDNDESPWDDSASAAITTTEAEWTRLSSGFQNAGYRDGITAGKESALQEGFDAGFAQAGAPSGRELGLLRGLASALHIHLSHTTTTQQQRQRQQQSREWEGTARTTAREIANTLATVRSSDIIVPEEEAGHVHCDAGGVSGHGEEEEEEEEREKGRRGEEAGSREVRTIEDLRALRVQLETLLRQVGLQVDLNLE